MDAMTHRKRRHIDVCLSDPVEFDGVTTGLDRYRLPYHALTQTSLGDIDVSTSFFGANLRAPILIGAMTGGAEMSKTINRNLAAAAQQLGIGMMLGSQRIMLDSALGERAADSFAVRDVAPDVLLFGNIGLSQLAKTAVPHLVKALDRVGADALAVHTNPLQEAMQHNGDTDFSGSLSRLREAAAALDYPVLLKEVGHGIGGAAAAELVGGEGQPPVAGIDVAGGGGPSCARVVQVSGGGGGRHSPPGDGGGGTPRAGVGVRRRRPGVALVARWGVCAGGGAGEAVAVVGGVGWG
ncbi:alpha-hydroxy-acid oxidizing protein, partial [Mycobacterium avium]|uniref:alpha-hydroxy-acid oxidizing protein n=1 Tax=Mycobacterium avium TaxID=1764 RepID=UPI0009BD5B2B